ncbi:T9SS type B sorting domain-containing protein [Zobellia sp. B3R18]|uniref:T9SS type B sorting domain-containing protein n=1 Tax=Zobellia sp. B3R18 TaxID=2841568 RepID=UPI001C06E94C|nr:T9SS type B sorting domain-containing protein [Zobellia sp. B3R18]MBU2975882.1 T9SS type B sorting domain-containing protein [Zobellia sp. B3R18]
MLPKKTQRILYALLLTTFSVVCTSAIAGKKVFNIYAEVASAVKEVVSEKSEATSMAKSISAESLKNSTTAKTAAAAPMFSTIIQGADNEVGCTANGFTVARFNLCGDSDDRVVSLSGSYSTVSWQVLGGSCSPNINQDCPDTNISCYTEVHSGPTFNLDASTIPATTGAEFRVVADGQQYFFKVKKSTITQTYQKKDFVCNNPGRIEITGLPNSYQFRIQEGSSGFGPYQSSSIFSNLDPGFYTVQARLNIPGEVCEYLYDVIEIRQVDIEIDVTFTNPVCSGETGSIDVTVNPEVPGPYVYTLLDDSGAEIEFTSTISSNTYTFGAVSEGTYAVKVETNDCKEDIPNGIPAPIQYTDTSGNPITVGTGLSPITVVTDTNGMSFGCSTISSVDIDVTPSGGSGTYSYTVSDGGDSGGTFTGTSAYTVTSPGTYTFYITDDQGCTAEKSEYVAELDPPDVTASDIVGTCTNGGGKVDFNVTDPRGFNLEFRATNNAGDPFTSSSTIPVADGTYSIVEVQYSQGAFTCVLSLPAVTVTSAGGLSGSASMTQDYTCVNGGGIIEFAPASGGSGTGYEYSIDNVNYQSGTTFTGLTPGNYIPYIKDDAGCFQALSPIDITEPTPPGSITFAQDNLDCATGTSRVTVDVLPATYTVTQYEIISSIPATTLPPAQASNVFPGLDLDTSYQFEITDASGCTYTASYTTGGFSTIRARVKSGGDRRVCPSATDGNGAFLIDGFATDYDYTVNRTAPTAAVISTGTSTDLEIPISGLGAGTYEITVTDNDTNCTSTTSFDIEEAATPLSITPTVTDMSCQNNNVGRVRADATGGFGGYRYELEWPPSDGRTQGPKTGRTFGNLTEEGTYTLTVIDSEGCRASTTFTLTSVDAPAITFDSADYCYSPTNNAEITVSSTAGSALIGTHQYRINGGALITPGTAGTHTFTGLVPGNYTIEVVDGNGCIASTSSIRIPPQVQVSLDIASEIPCGGDGEMEIDISGGDISNLGATSYTIEYRDVSPNPFAPVAGHNGVQLPSGNFNYTVPFGDHGDYQVTVTDSNGCTNTSEIITFEEPTNIAATHRIEGPSCGDANSGFVEIIPTVSSGIPPFEVVFAPAGNLTANPSNPDPTLNYVFSDQTIYSGLTAGNYEYVVKDARNCVTAVVPITVAADGRPSPDVTATPIDATCSPGSPGALSGGVTIGLPTAGVENYTVIIEDNFGNPFYTQNNVSDSDFPLAVTDPSLVPGNYQLIVLDSRGCRDIEAFTIGTLSLDIIPNYPPPPATCSPGGTTVCVDILNGSGSYEIRLADPDPLVGWTTPSNPPANHCFNNLLWGVSYTVEVRDLGTGCTYEEVITLPDGPGGNVNIVVDNATCRNGDVGVNYNITSGTAPFDVVITNLDTGEVVYTDSGTSLTTMASAISVSGGRYGVAVEDAGDCSYGDEGEAILLAPRVDIISNENANCNALGQLTVRGSGGTPYATGSPYLYAYVPAGTPVDNDGTATPSDPSDDFSEASTVALPGALAPGIDYDIWVKDANDCAYRISAAVIQLNPDLPPPTISVNNQCDVTTPVGGFTITVEVPGDIDTPTFTLNGESQTPPYVAGTPTQATFTVNNIGSYPVNVIDANGCDVDDVAEVFQVLSASGDFTSEPSCEETDGEITITADGGSGDFTYTLTGTDIFGSPVNIVDPDNDGIFPGMAAGDYQVEVTDNQVTDGTNPCSFTVSGIVRSAPTSPDIDETGESDVSCNGANDGSISASLIAGTDVDGIQEYNLYSSTLAAMPSGLDTTGRINTNISGSFSGLTPGTYVIEVVTDRNCFDREEVVINEPPLFEIDVTSGTLVCNPASNQYSTTIVSASIVGGNVGNGAPYGYKINLADSYQSSPDFEIVDTGSDQVITVYARDANGCEYSDSVTVLAPNTVTATITQIRPMDCENPERIRIDVTGSTNFIIEDQGFSVSPVASVSQPSGSFVEFDLPMVAGEYRLQINDVGGCTYPITAYNVAEPVLPTVSITESQAVGCFGATDGELTINVSGFTGVYEYWVYESSDPGFSGGAFGTPVAGNSTGTIDTAVDGNPAVITGIEGGNHRVVIREQGKTVSGCNVFSNATVLSTPSVVLAITSLDEIGRVGCSDDLGEIVATTQGGWDASPYEYMLEYESTVGSGFAPHSNPAYATFAANGTNDTFTGLSSGNYRVTVRDIEGCTHSRELELIAVPQIEVEAIITRELECPTGNDAVIVAVEPGTTTPGAIGGVPGAGYQYRLLHLGSNNNADVVSMTGFQSDPEFTGTTGVIPGGWYAVEVVSTLNCGVVSAPIQVIPPPPINPALIQTSVPACGNSATMMIRVNNPQGGTYEYSVNNSGGPWLPIDELDANGLPVKTGIPGVIGSSYRFEVRKVGGLSSCLARKTNGITITAAEPLTLDPTSPTFDVSCAYEVDGRIEAVANGGTGIYEFRIYNSDPGTDAFVAETLPTYQNRTMQDFGTFENLDAGDYWISVISRANCGVVQGPFSIAPAEPVTIAYSSTPTTCYGETDGTITMNVTSPTVGLVQFAIEPNLSEFFSDSDNPTVYTFTDLPANTPSNPSYTVLVQDAEGCPQTFEIVVDEPTELEIADFSTTPETCIGFEDGTARLTVTGGTPFVDPLTSVEYYETRLVGPNSDGTEVFLRNDDLYFDNLIGGEGYIAFVQDANGCSTNVFIPIEIGVDLTASPVVQYGCEGIFPNSTASVQMQEESLIPELLFALNPIDPTDAITALATTERSWGDLPAGDYTAYIYHENGCTNFVEFTIDAYDPLTLFAEKTGPNEITATAEGGFGGYEFFFDGVSYGSEGLYTTTESGEVEIRVVDQNGCEAVAVIPFEFTGMLEIPNFFTPNGDNENDFWAPGNREFFPNIEVIIYDRYGRVVAELDQVSKWDGLYEGKELPTGDYWYVVNQNDDRDIRYVGHFTLYR